MSAPREDQPIALPSFPTTPAGIPSLATVDELLSAYHSHLFTAVGGRQGCAQSADPLRARHALAALALGEAIVATFISERWHLVHDALVAGATADDVGAAIGGLEVQEIAAGLTSWADREQRAGRLALDEVDAVIELVEGGAR